MENASDLSPGADYPGTFQEVDEWFRSDTACREYIRRLRWPSGSSAISDLPGRTSHWSDGDTLLTAKIRPIVGRLDPLARHPSQARGLSRKKPTIAASPPTMIIYQGPLLSGEKRTNREEVTVS